MSYTKLDLPVSLANRIKRVLQSLIDHDHTGFFSNRYMGSVDWWFDQVFEYKK